MVKSHKTIKIEKCFFEGIPASSFFVMNESTENVQFKKSHEVYS
jgi:hypothetical protein